MTYRDCEEQVGISTGPRTKREHVIPQALGTFKHNWTLDCVCDDCNHFFSRELELALGRDSAEAFIRVETGVKPPSAAAKFLNRRMKLKLNSKGAFDGAHVVTRPTEEGDGTYPDLPPQIGFRSPGGTWHYILEGQLYEESIRRAVHGPFEVKIVGRGDDLVRLSQRLARLGFNFVQTYRLLDQPIADGPFSVEHKFDVDRTLLRAAAKIAFNYSAKVLGPDVMRRSNFDTVRRFVRFDEGSSSLAIARPDSILVGSEANTTRTHACGLGWVEERRMLVAIVSLFNQVTYWVRMCTAESDEWRAISSQHLFDPISHTIRDLLKAD